MRGLRDGDWSGHGLELAVSAVERRIPDGAGLPVIFPAWMRHVWKSHPERFLTFGAEGAVHDAVEATIDDLQGFFMSMGMPSTLGELGIVEDDIDQMICGLRVTRGASVGTFRTLTLADARTLYESAL